MIAWWVAIKSYKQYYEGDIKIAGSFGGYKIITTYILYTISTILLAITAFLFGLNHEIRKSSRKNKDF